MERIRRIAVCAVFFLVLALVPALLFLTPDREVSAAERRKLRQAPKLTADALLSGRFQTDLEAYALDQFPGRDSLRTAKAVCSAALLGRLDNNGLYGWEGSLCKLDGPLDRQQVLRGAEKLNSLRTRFLSGSRCWYAVIPDKHFYASRENGYPALDTQALADLLQEQVQGMTYVNLIPELTLEDYFRTDSHWRQERLQPVAGALAASMDFPAPRLSAWASHTLEGFRGVYAGQSALPCKGEPLTYLTAPAARQAVVWDAESKTEIPVYQPEKFAGMDPYDVYLDGAKALLEIDTGADTGRELLLFRDSFGSSLAPLLLEAYGKVTLIDLRYLSSETLGELVDFHGQDVLFLYSASVWNNSAMLR